MKALRRLSQSSLLSTRVLPRVAVIGGGVGGLACARVLGLSGFHPVVFEAEGSAGGRCSSRSSPIGWFDDGAQFVGDARYLRPYAEPRDGELAALHPWMLAATPREEERESGVRDRDKIKDEEEVTPTLKLVGMVGVPSMRSLAETIALSAETRLLSSIGQVERRGTRWILHGEQGEIDEEFEALVLAMPAPLALPLTQQSSALSAALRTVRYRSRWVLMLGTDRHIGLPGYGEFEGSPIERVVGMHTKPGRSASGPQRWFAEADARWSSQHEHDDEDTVADLLLANFRAHAGRSVTPQYLRARQWRHAFVDNPAVTPAHSMCLWDGEARLGICGDSVVASRIDLVHRSGVDLAQAIATSLRAGAQPASLYPTMARPPQATALLRARALAGTSAASA